MSISALIDKFDMAEIVRDQIAAILVNESASQQQLAITAGKPDPTRWALRVFLERANPWAEWSDFPETSSDSADSTPIVSVRFDSETFDASASSPVDRQKTSATYNIDCYGLGISADDGAGGHIPGDAMAAFESQRALRLVRNILMSGDYTYLGMRGSVIRRWPVNVQSFQPEQDGRAAQNVAAARLQLEVQFNEFSPQVQGQPLELLTATVTRRADGLVYLTTSYDGT